MVSAGQGYEVHGNSWGDSKLLNPQSSTEAGAAFWLVGGKEAYRIYLGWADKRIPATA